MKLTIEVTKDSVYLRTDKRIEDGGYVMSLFRENGQDSVGYDGDPSKREVCLKIADVLLGSHKEL